MQKIKNRSEIPEELKWDLTTIYKTDEDFYKDIEKAKKIIDEMYSYKGKIFKTKNNLVKYLKNDENLHEKVLQFCLISSLLRDE